MYETNDLFPKVISTQEARKILGKDSSELTEDQIDELICYLTLLAERYFGDNGSKIN